MEPDLKTIAFALPQDLLNVIYEMVLYENKREAAEKAERAAAEQAKKNRNKPKGTRCLGCMSSYD